MRHPMVTQGLADERFIYLVSLESLSKGALPNLLDVGQAGKLPYQALHAGQRRHFLLLASRLNKAFQSCMHLSISHLMRRFSSV